MTQDLRLRRSVAEQLSAHGEPGARYRHLPGWADVRLQAPHSPCPCDLASLRVVLLVRAAANHRGGFATAHDIAYCWWIAATCSAFIVTAYRVAGCVKASSPELSQLSFIVVLLEYVVTSSSTIVA